MLSCGITHTAIVPLDLVKCRLQTDPDKYKGIVNGFRVGIHQQIRSKNGFVLLKRLCNRFGLVKPK